MADPQEQLKILHQKVQQFVKQYNALQKENNSLKKELFKRDNLLEKKNKHAEDLQQKMDSLNLGSQIWSEEDKKSLQKRIDIYLREIEKCLQLLNH